MELSKKQIGITKGIAIGMMLCLHLFNREYKGLFQPGVFIGANPLTYYISLFCDCCVCIYAFCSGYGLYITYQKNSAVYPAGNRLRLFKLYLNYWVITVLFAVVAGFLLGRSDEYPGDWVKFVTNFTSLDSSYNGASWFLSCYALLVLLSPWTFRLVNRQSSLLILGCCLGLYVLGYYFRVSKPIVPSSLLPRLLLNQLVMVANSMLPFLVGAIAYKQKWFSHWMAFCSKWPAKNAVMIALIVSMIIAHGFVPSLFVAAFTGVAFVFLFNAISLVKSVEWVLLYLSQHSTNIWLVHMYLYVAYAKDLCYAPQNPLLIYFWVMGLSLVASHLIDLVHLPLQRLFVQRFFSDAKSAQA
jgi:hypothetical protein